MEELACAGLQYGIFQFELLTKRDWMLVVILAGLIALALGGGVYWLAH